MSDGNSSIDDELDLVVGHLLDSGSDDSSSDEYESSSEEPQGAQNLASDPRYVSTVTLTCLKPQIHGRFSM